jgi:hypothetical protein
MSKAIIFCCSGLGCGGDLFHTGGSLTSPSYPGNYSQDSDCRWRVRVPGGLRVNLVFTSMLTFTVPVLFPLYQKSLGLDNLCWVLHVLCTVCIMLSIYVPLAGRFRLHCGSAIELQAASPL